MQNLQLQKKICNLEHLDHLKALTGQLPPVPNLEDFVKRSTNCVELKSKIGGPILLFYCYQGDSIAIARTFASAGTVMESHNHKEKYIIVVYKGSIELVFDGDVLPNNLRNGDNKHVLKENDVFEIMPDITHKLHWLEDTWSLLITIPPAKGFPHA